MKFIRCNSVIRKNEAPFFEVLKSPFFINLANVKEIIPIASKDIKFVFYLEYYNKNAVEIHSEYLYRFLQRETNDC